KDARTERSDRLFARFGASKKRKMRGGVSKEIGAPASGILATRATSDAPARRSRTRYLKRDYSRRAVSFLAEKTRIRNRKLFTISARKIRRLTPFGTRLA